MSRRPSKPPPKPASISAGKSSSAPRGENAISGTVSGTISGAELAGPVELSDKDREWLALEAETPEPSERLSPEQESELAELLVSAWRPKALPSSLNDTLVELCLEDPLAEATEEEQAESERLREALDLGVGHPLADLARGVRAAHDPGRLDGERHQALLDAALKHQPERAGGTLIRVRFGAVATFLAAAAALLIWMRAPAPETASVAEGPPAAASELAVSRSTSAMFHEKFDTQRTSERVDRIATARARELRSNRYASWGAR